MKNFNIETNTLKKATIWLSILKCGISLLLLSKYEKPEFKKYDWEQLK